MLNKFNTVVVSMVVLSLVGCSGIKPLSSTKAQNKEKVTVETDDIAVTDQAEQRKSLLEENKRILDQVKKKEQDNHQISGTAKISDEESRARGDVYFLYGAEHLNLKNNYFDIPVVYNDAVKGWMKYFLNRGKNYFERYVQRSGRYAPVLGKILADHGLPRDLIFLAMAESGFQNKAKSWAKAVGPWQFMPYTGRKYGLEINWYLDERRDPIKATISAARYLKDLYKMFGSWELAAAGYNAGEGKVSRAIKRYNTSNFWKIRRGRYLKRETKNYVPKIMALAIIGKNLSSFGFEDIDFHEPLDFDEILIPGNSDLVKIAQITGVPFSEIQRLNPEIMRWMTPPTVEQYPLRMPVGIKTVWESCCTKSDIAANDFQIYKMKSNSSLRAVAKKFRLPVKVIANLNGVSAKAKMRRGQEVMLPFRSGQSRQLAMYSDLYERPRKRVRKWRSYKTRIRRALRKGKKITRPKEYYTVKRGDTLWQVAKKTGVSLDTIIRSNYTKVKNRMIREGDKLVIR